jgi:enoyl-CoA hydratase/carnithine racemase
MIEAEVEGAIGRVTLNSPATHNALDRSAMDALMRVFEDWSTRSDLRALVLTGTGRSFCSGAALGEVTKADWTEDRLTALCDALEAFPAPTVARLNGGVYGGGMELALSCDFRVGVTGMRAFAPPARFGIHYAPAGLARVIDRLGPQVARRVFLLGETFDDAALLRHGFLDRLVAPEELDSATDWIAETLAAAAPLAVRGMKRSIVELSKGAHDDAAANRRIATCTASADHAEGMAARREKRKPRFTGT